MKKVACLFLSFLIITASSACSFSSEFDPSKEITVISREDGSGTRGAFVELFKLEWKGENGERKDLTTKEAIISKATDVLMTNVSSDKYAIGYISLGSLNDTVKSVTIDGVAPTPENVKNDSYKISRSFSIVTNGEAEGLTKDFIDFILSSDGQEVISKMYISVDDEAAPYSGDLPSGKIVIAGSSSVTPIMEKLKEAYLKINPNASIEIQQSDSSSGITGTLEGTCNIGMISRDLKESEQGQLVPIEIALDGIALVVNKENPVDNLTSEQVKAIFTGEDTEWSEIIDKYE